MGGHSHTKEHPTGPEYHSISVPEHLNIMTVRTCDAAYVAAEVGLDITALSECKLCEALPEVQTGHKTYKATAKESSQAPSVCRLCQARMQRPIARRRARRTAGVLRHASLRPEWPPTCLQGGALLCSGRCNSSSERPELDTQTRERGLNSVALMWGWNGMFKANI